MSKRPFHKRKLDFERLLSDLRHARDELADGGHPRAAASIRRAIKSTDGARRHALNRQSRLLDQSTNPR
ncbi:hypothetical protein [Nisaea sediminum]|jgi:hypothetical protein|uniref:hypothetical protein n=1 Tax=Nisaea sediminum TaxID=2775867 RepID=UPI001866118D|nr:hypothetical protein [Nisaea sediminum]